MPVVNLYQGAAFILLSELFFVLMGTQVRSLSQGLSNEMIVFFRNLFGLQIMIPLLLRHGVSAFKTAKPQLHLLRGLAGVSAMYCFFYAIAHLELASAMILKMSAPLFIPIIAWVWLKEQLSWLIGFVVIIGFCGISLIIKPDPGAINGVALIALAGGFFCRDSQIHGQTADRHRKAGNDRFLFRPDRFKPVFIAGFPQLADP